MIRIYANRLKANWILAGWNRQKHKEILYDIGWAGLHNSLKTKNGPITPTCARFDFFDEFFDKAAASEVSHVEKKNPQQQQHQQQQQPQQKQPTDSASKGGKRSYPPSISKPSNTT
jgi:hypothetical protein